MAGGPAMAADSGVASIVDTMNDVFRIDYAGADSHLHEFYIGSGSSQWGSQDLTAILDGPAVAAGSISGQITAGGSGLPGVTVSLSGTSAAGATVSESATTNSNGNYWLSVPVGGSYAVTPSDASGDTFSPNSAGFSNFSVNQTANFTDNGNGGYDPGGPPNPVPGTAPYPNLLSAMPPPGPGAPNCNDISGIWTDSESGVWSLLQQGVSVTGTLTDSTTSWQVSGSGSAPQYTLTASSPQPSLVNGVYQDGASLSVTLTGCLTASASITLIAPPGQYFESTGTNTAPGGTITLARPAAPTFTLTSPTQTAVSVPGLPSPGPVLAFSTGDSNIQLTTTSSIASYPMDVVYTPAFWADPNSTCPNGVHVYLNMAQGTGSGTATSAISASPAGCSGVFQIMGAVGGTTTNPLVVVVPPQALIQQLHAEAHGFSDNPSLDPNQVAQLSLGMADINRFAFSANPNVFNGESTYQALVNDNQVAHDGTANSSTPTLLKNATMIYAGPLSDATGGSPCYWSPSDTEWTSISSAIGTTKWPTGLSDPKCFVRTQTGAQIVIRTSMPNNVIGNKTTAPAFIFERERPSPSSPTVVQIP